MINLDKISPTRKSGEEPLKYHAQPLPFTLLDFWQWSVSDIVSNATRGRFAEFIVATALEIDLKNEIRDEWQAYDLQTPEGIKIEVKSAAYLQSWFQKIPSTISFSTRATKSWDSTNLQSKEKVRQADVYVFCLLTHTEKMTLDPLNLNQWEFYILSTQTLNEYARSQHSITLKSLQRLTKAVNYDQIRQEVLSKFPAKLTV